MSHQHVRLNQKRWARVRRQVFERDGYRCSSCGRAGRLECDHRVALHLDPDQDPYQIDNLQTLCRGCHIAKTRGENTPQDLEGDAWRDFLQEGITKH